MKRPKPRLQITGIIGDPIAHTLSPVMHNANFRSKKLPFAYFAFHVRPAALSRFLTDVRTWKGLRGFNVTIPHKEAILKHLDGLSPEARAIGAANTVVVAGKKLLGFNTDSAGYLQSLKDETGFSPKGKTTVVLGAGGAARSVVYALAKAGAREIAVANRTRSRAKKIAQEFGKKFPKTRIVDIPFQMPLLHKIFPEIDLLVNTTSVGLKGTRFAGLPLKSLKKTSVVSDLVYRPRLTPLLESAKRHRLTLHPGLGMLLHQGALAAKLWTKKQPDLRVMKKALLDALKRT